MSTKRPAITTPSGDSTLVPTVKKSRTHKTVIREWSEKDKAMEIFDLIHRVNYLLLHHDLYGPDGTYTWPDGERWAKIKEGNDE